MDRPLIPSRCRARRRGSIYLFVLATAMILAAIGFSVIAVARVNTRMAGQANDCTEAETLAEDAVEYALSTLAADASWRTTYTSGAETAARPLGGGTISFKLVDEVNGNLADDPRDPARLYGIGRAHSAVRLYSVLLTPKATPMDVLKTAFHSGTNVEVPAAMAALGAPLSANGQFYVRAAGVVYGDIQATSIRKDGTVGGNITILSSPLAMPQAAVFDSYQAMATDIPFALITGSKITGRVLSPASNPYGLPNPKGVYHIRVTSGTLTIEKSRLVATLLVTLDPGAKLKLNAPYLMEPPQADYPTLIVRAAGSGSVEIGGTTSPLSESGAVANLNPAGTPYPWPSGSADLDMLDTYPAEIRGLAHVIGAAITTTIGNDFAATGTVISEGLVSCGSNIRFTYDPNVLDYPPLGYDAARQMVPVANSWRWEKAP